MANKPLYVKYETSRSSLAVVTGFVTILAKDMLNAKLAAV